MTEGLKQPTEAPPIWQPFPNSPQERAYHSTADIIGYGGAAGGGKTDLGLGKAFTKFKRARIFRRNYADLTDMVERGDAILDDLNTTFVWGNKRSWELPDGRVIRLSAVQHEKDLKRFRGRPADLLMFDEATEFPLSFIQFISGWLRTDDPTIKPQVILTFNPPGTAEGEWVIDYFKPWIDPTHPNPAKDGELRWYITVGDHDTEVDSSDPVTIEGQIYYPKSRTFFRALVDDNPVYMASGYDKQLESLHEPLRSQLRRGDFTIRLTDDRYQVIPTLWVLQAMQRWERGQRPEVRPRAIAQDVARGGKDETTTAVLRGVWFDIEGVPGVDTPDGDSAVDQLEPHYEPGIPVSIDVTGVGAAVYDSACRRFDTADVFGFVAGGASHGTDASGMYQFANLRSEAWWLMREALNPDNGEDIALPPIPKLRADLTAPRYKVQGGKYQVESKDEIYKRLKRSTDYGDVAVQVWHMAQENVPQFDYTVG